MRGPGVLTFLVLAPGDLAWRRSFTLLTHVAKLLKSTWGGHINMAISYSVEAIIPLLGDDRKAELSRGGATARRAWERAGCWIPKSDVSSEGHSPSIGNMTAPTDSLCRQGQRERRVGNVIESMESDQRTDCSQPAEGAPGRTTSQ